MNIKNYFKLLKQAGGDFMEDQGMKLSAALSYYTIFSLAPMLLVMISVLSLFFGRDAIQGELFDQIRDLVGNQAATQLQEIIKNAEMSNKSGVAAALGIGTLLIGATGVFAEIQTSINYIWSIEARPEKGWLRYLKTRLISFSLIVALGFLLIVTLGVNTVVDLLSEQLSQYFSEASVIIFYIINLLVGLILITSLFAVIFKVLPDGQLRWRECFVGAAFTAILFGIGKFLISFYIGQSDLGATYGASASIIILLSWIYYSSIILYFGAEFTKVYANSDGVHIMPSPQAVLIVKERVGRHELHQANGKS